MPSSVDFKFIVMLIASIAGIAVPVCLWQIDQSARTLNLKILSVSNLRPSEGSTIISLKISLNGVDLDRPYLTVMQLSNDGGKSVSTAEFESAIRIVGPKSISVAKAEVSRISPEDLKPEISSHLNEITIKPLLLNPRDMMQISAITAGGLPSFSIESRIAGISKIGLIDQSGIKKSNFRLSVEGLLGFVLFALYMSLTHAALLEWRKRRFGLVLLLAAVASCIGGATLIKPIMRDFDLANWYLILVIVFASFAALPSMLARAERQRSAP